MKLQSRCVSLSTTPNRNSHILHITNPKPFPIFFIEPNKDTERKKDIGKSRRRFGKILKEEHTLESNTEEDKLKMH